MEHDAFRFDFIAAQMSLLALQACVFEMKLFRRCLYALLPQKDGCEGRLKFLSLDERE